MTVSRWGTDCKLYLVFISARFGAKFSKSSANPTPLFLHWLILVDLSAVKWTGHRLSMETRCKCVLQWWKPLPSQIPNLYKRNARQQWSQSDPRALLLGQLGKIRLETNPPICNHYKLNKTKKQLPEGTREETQASRVRKGLDTWREQHVHNS